MTLYVLAQIPPTKDGVIVPVEAETIAQAIDEAQKRLGVTLTRMGGGNYTDGPRRFFLYFGERGMEQFGQSFAAFLDGLN